MYQVLIAEDELLERVGIVSVIGWSKFGMEVVADVANGEEALEAYQKYHPDLLITDIKMPVMNGMELIKKIRETDNDIAIVIITCVEDFETVRSALTVNVSGYILKMTMTVPEIENVLEKVEKELDKRKKLKVNRELSANQELAIKTGLFYQYFFESGGDEFDNPIYSVYGSLQECKLIIPILQIELCKHTDKLGASDGVFLRKSVLITIEGILRDYGQKHVLCVHQNQIIMLFAYGKERPDEECYAECELIAQHLENYIKSYFNMTASCGFSKIGNAAMLKELFQQANMALDSCFIFGQEHYYSHRIIDASASRTKIKQNLDRINVLYLQLFGKETAETFARATTINYEANESRAMGFKELFIQWLQLPGALMRLSDMILFSLQQKFENRIMQSFSLDECAGEYCNFLQEMASIDKSRPDLNPSIVKAVHFIKSNICTVTLNDVARHVNLCPSYFSTAFKKDLGVSFSDYVLQTKIARAKELLIEKECKISAVSNLLGFVDPSYFSRVFKKATGIHPNEYRRKHLKE